MTVGEALKLAEERLKVVSISSARLDTQILLEHVTQHGRAWLLAHPDDQLTAKQQNEFESLVAQRIKRLPIARLTGTREFYGLDFIVTKDVLIPRTETEKMVEFAIKHAAENSRLIDIGTGCGAIAIAIAKYRPDLDVVATEIDAAALDVARLNNKKHGLSIKFVQSDLFESIEGRFESVVTNLPYLKDSEDLMPEAQTEPAVALFGGPGDGLNLYRKFLSQLPARLSPSGYLFTECDPWQQPALIKEAAKIGLKPIEDDYFILGFQLK